jgi:phage gp16-like protein
VQLSTSVTTHPVTESYIRRIPVRVPYEERVVEVATKKSVRNVKWNEFKVRDVLKHRTRKVNRFNNVSVRSALPDTIKECWNESVRAKPCSNC